MLIGETLKMAIEKEWVHKQQEHMNTRDNGKIISDTGTEDRQYFQKGEIRLKQIMIRIRVFPPFKKLNKQKKRPKTQKPKTNKLIKWMMNISIIVRKTLQQRVKNL